jgi:hypothetical protein
VNVGDGKPDTGRAGPLPRAGAIKDRVDRAGDRRASLSRIENCMQLVSRPDQLGCLPLLTSEVAGGGRELWIWLILLTGGCPRGIGKLVDQLHYPGQLDPQKREHIRQCNVIRALMALQAARRWRTHGRAADQLSPSGQHPPASQAVLRRHRARRRPAGRWQGHSVMTTGGMVPRLGHRRGKDFQRYRAVDAALEGSQLDETFIFPERPSRCA